MTEKLSHFDSDTHKANMVDITNKLITTREAIARGKVLISKRLVRILLGKSLEKGDAFTIAQTAGILAAKQTGLLIPLCHPLSLDSINVELTMVENTIQIESKVKTTAKTGVEMEALVAVNVAALTFYDMCKAVDKSMQITKIGLYKKTGGKSGDYFNPGLTW